MLNFQTSYLKSCRLDPMASTLASTFKVLLLVLTNINNSLQSGCFSDLWKEVLVFPLLKKPGLDVIFKNTFALWVNCLLFWKTLRGPYSTRFIDTWLVTTYSRLDSVLTEKTTCSAETNSTSENNKRYPVKCELAVLALQSLYCLTSVLLLTLLIIAFCSKECRQILM